MRLILLLLLAGCGSNPAPSGPSWYKPGATTQDFYIDQGQCQAQALSSPYGVTTQTVLIYASCMRGKGWSPS